MTTTSLYQAVHTFSLAKDQVDRSREDLEAALQTYERNIPTIKETVHRVSKRLREVHVALLQGGRIQKYRLEDHLTAEEVADFKTLTEILGPFSGNEIGPVQPGAVFRVGKNIYSDVNYSNSVRIGMASVGMVASLLILTSFMGFKDAPELKYFFVGVAGLFGLLGISDFLPYECKNALPSFAGILEERAAYIQKHMSGEKNEF